MGGIPGSLAVWLALAAPSSGQTFEAALPRSPVSAVSLAGASGLLLPTPFVSGPKISSDLLLFGGASTAKRVEFLPAGGRVRLAYLRPDQPIEFDGDALRRYRAALGTEDAAETVVAAAELARSGGVAVEPLASAYRGEDQQGLRLVPDSGGSRLNRLAHRLLDRLGASLEYVPGRTGTATGAFNAVERRLMVPGFLHEESYPGLLHEIRHAFFSMLLRRGDLRLFHLSALSRTGAPLAPRAEDYGTYVSFEELSTFPKTLRHLVSLVESAPDAETRAFRLSLLKARARQYATLLATAEYLTDRVRGRDAAGTLLALPVDPESPIGKALEIPEGGTLYRVNLGHADLFLPVERPPRVLAWYRRLFGQEDGLPLEVLRLKAELTLALVAESSPELTALWEALKSDAPDLALVHRRADRLVAAAARQDRSFRDRNPAK